MTTVATITISSAGAAHDRISDTRRILDRVPADVCLLPGGWFSAGKDPAQSTLPRLEERLARVAEDRLVCFGVDGRDAKPWPRDQLAVAISGRGILGIARKFHAAPVERDVVDLAASYLSQEADLQRIVEHDERRFYLAVCYDCFGIRQRGLANPGVDAVLTAVHGFYRVGQPNSGAAYFARHGIAGASKAWGIPTFASAAFFDRPLPNRWPTGVRWKSGKRSTVAWRYDENGLRPDRTQAFDLDTGKCRVDTFTLRHAAATSNL